MTENGNTAWLKYVIYILIVVISAITGFHVNTIAQFPDKYVRLERYNSDMIRVEKKLDKILDHMTRLQD